MCIEGHPWLYRLARATWDFILKEEEIGEKQKTAKSFLGGVSVRFLLLRQLSKENGLKEWKIHFGSQFLRSQPWLVQLPLGL